MTVLSSHNSRQRLPWRQIAAGAVLCGVSACETTTRDPEFANIYPWNVVPKSSAEQMVSAFKTICLAKNSDEQQKRLQRAGYLKTRETGRGVRTYVVDNRKPAVMLRETNGAKACAIGAEARTGQSQALRALVVSEFPDATPIDARNISNSAEAAWATPNGAVLYLDRHGPKVAPPRLIFAISRPKN